MSTYDPAALECLAAIGINQNGFHHTLSSFDVTKLRRKRTQVH